VPNVRFDGFPHTDTYRGSVCNGDPWRAGDVVACTKSEADYLIENWPDAFKIVRARRRKRSDTQPPKDRMIRAPKRG